MAEGGSGIVWMRLAFHAELSEPPLSVSSAYLHYLSARAGIESAQTHEGPVLP